MKRLTLFLLMAVTVSTAVFAYGMDDTGEEDTYGYWWTPKKDAKIKMYKAKNGKLYGKIAWLKDPNNEDGTPKKDDKNPVESLRDREMMGLVLFMGFEYDGDGEWEDGKVYAADSGKLYDCNMTLKDKNTLEVRGYVGISMFGRTETFERAPAP